VDAHEALVSPVRRLPLDILQQVFIACLPTHRNCVMSASEALVLLGRICSSWRAISLSIPQLWSRLHIVQPECMVPPSFYRPTTNLIEEKLAQRLETTRTWLSRSGQCPLSISLRGASGQDTVEATPSATHIDDFLRALILFASRWQHIHITAEANALRTMSHLTERDVPMLESAIIDYPYSRARAVRWEALGMLRSHRMRSFSAPADSFRESLPLRWHQLTALKIEGRSGDLSLTSDQILRTMSRCPELRTCKLVVTVHITMRHHSPSNLNSSKPSS
jgi:hypothetical protein